MTRLLELAPASILLATSIVPITDTDWERVTSENGVIYIAIVMLAIMILFSRSRVKKDDAREERRMEIDELRRIEDKSERETRHRETIEQQDKISDRFTAMHTVQMTHISTHSAAIHKMADEIRDLSDRVPLRQNRKNRA